MTQPVLDPPGGSYDDLPEPSVSTLLAVPLRLPPLARPAQPVLTPQPPPTPRATSRRRGSHRGVRAKSDQRGRRGGPRHRHTTTPPRDAQPVHPIYATVRVGALAALIVFIAAAIALATLAGLLN